MFKFTYEDSKKALKIGFIMMLVSLSVGIFMLIPILAISQAGGSIKVLALLSYVIIVIAFVIGLIFAIYGGIVYKMEGKKRGIEQGPVSKKLAAKEPVKQVEQAKPSSYTISKTIDKTRKNSKK